MFVELFDTVLLGRLCEKWKNKCITTCTYLYAIYTQHLALFESWSPVCQHGQQNFPEDCNFIATQITQCTDTFLQLFCLRFVLRTY
jgi:hypothetical protein